MNSDIDNKYPDTTLLQLQQLGLIDTNATNNDAQSNQTVSNNPQDDNPWFIQIFFGFSGILASLFFIGFLTLLLQNTGALDSVIVTFLIGMSSAAVVWLRHAARLNSENNLPSAVVKGGNYE